MPSFTKTIKLTFFGSHSYTSLKQKKSLYDNFVAICSLPFYKPDSNETKALINLLKEVDLHSTDVNKILNKTERMQDIAKLELVKMGIRNWYLDRNKTSERVVLIQRFEREINSLRDRLILLDSNEVMNNTRRDKSAPRVWQNPLYQRDELTAHLSVSQKIKFNQLEQRWLNHLTENGKKQIFNIQTR